MARQMAWGRSPERRGRGVWDEGAERRDGNGWFLHGGIEQVTGSKDLAWRAVSEVVLSVSSCAGPGADGEDGWCFPTCFTVM